MRGNEHAVYAVKKSIQKNGWIDLPAEGTSMFPLIQRGNVCRFVVCGTSELEKGDVVLFQAADHRLVAHRFLGVKKNSRYIRYLFKGDTNLGADTPVTDDHIIGRLLFIRKGNRTMHTGGPFFFIWRIIVLSFPPISSFLRAFLNYKEAGK
ncbi:hypothetical protein [Domibacillus sp.]|uniref:hypothetical protein n=1 Tax=Domibacillus sp. TaxID=1969783 RepID=UPI0028128204|nr:hypothetical protein [Domibacillus sp.]